jgi:hypothetical protein
MMRSAPLTTLKGGIDRRRTKGGARADTLYDLLNGYVTDEGTAVIRPGSQRIASVDTATRGLCYFDGSLHVFCNTAVFVPEGFTLNILVHPDIEGTATEPTHILTAGAAAAGDPFDFTGFDIADITSPGAFGAIDPGVLEDGTVIAVLISYDAGGNTNYELWAQAPGGTGLAGGGTPAATDCFEYLYIDAFGGVTLRNDAADTPGGTDSGDWRIWIWTGAVTGTDAQFVDGTDYDLYFDSSPTGSEGTSGADIAITKIHFAAPFMGALYVVAEFENGNVWHYWLQEGAVWEADKVYAAGDLVTPADPTGLVYRAERLGNAYPSWAAGQSRSDGTDGYDVSVIEPTTYNGFYYTCVAATGTDPRSGTIEPTWPEEDGAQITETTDNGDYTSFATITAPPSANQPTDTTRDRYRR